MTPSPAAATEPVQPIEQSRPVTRPASRGDGAGQARGGRVDQRQRILDIALDLMAADGAQSVSMRRLATACGINVAALYHYFPSKAHIIRAVIAERRYDTKLLDEPPPVDASLPPRERMEQLITLTCAGALDEERVWRLLLGEALRDDPDAKAMVAELLATLDQGLQRWLATLFADCNLTPAAARVIRNQVLAFVVEDLQHPAGERLGTLPQAADDIAGVLFD